MLAALALTPVFADGGWVPNTVFAVATVAAAGTALRALRAPLWVQPLGGAAALLTYLCAVFGPGGGLGGYLPTPRTLAALVDLASTGFRDIAELSAPAPTRFGLVLLTTAGVGAVAVVVDALAAGAGRAALAGMPLLTLYAVPVAIEADRVGWHWFALGALGYLWLLRADSAERARRWGHTFRPSPGATEPPGSGVPTGGTGVALAGLGLLVAIAVPAALPDLSTAALLTTGEGAGIGRGGTRDGETVNPITRLKGELVQRDNVEMLRVRTNDENPFYLRLTALDVFRRNQGWSQSPLEATVGQRVQRGIPTDVTLRNPGLPGQDHTTTVEVRGLRESQYLPVYPHLRSLDVEGDWRYEPQTQTVFSVRTNTRGVRYTLRSFSPDYQTDALAASAPLAPDDPLQRRFTVVPPDPSVSAVVADIVAGATTPYEKVLALDAFFSPVNGFRYSLRTKPGTTGSDLLDFLQRKEGYCEQYASALAYLARVAGLPARVAIGFTRGDRREGYWSVGSHDAHAWTEIYFTGIGWVPFDPTPLGAGGNVAPLPWAAPDAPDAATGRGALGSNAPAAPGSTPSSSAQPVRPDRERAQAPGNAAVPAGGTTSASWWPGTVAVALLLTLAAAPGVARVARRRRRYATFPAGDPVAAAHAAWDELLDTLTDLRLPVDDAETPRATAARVAEPEDGPVDDTVRAALYRLAVAEERARYAQATAPDRDLGDALTEVRRGLFASAGRRGAVRAWLWPRSVFEAAAASLVAAREKVSGALSAAVERRRTTTAR